MKTITLKKKLLLSFVSIVAIVGILIALFGFYAIKKSTAKRARQEVDNGLNAAWSVYRGHIQDIARSLGLVYELDNVQEFKDRIGLDYLVVSKEKSAIKSKIALKAFEGTSVGGTRIISEEELKEIGLNVFNKAKIEIQPTKKARKKTKNTIREAMAIEYAFPVLNANGTIEKIVYGGRVINRDFELVDKIRDLAFENSIYQGKAVGTVTIFQDDVRITTNVLGLDGKRAVGTRVSEEVYNSVIKKGLLWLDRAFVVSDWYLTAYEPIRDIENNIIGILYVGILESPIVDGERTILVIFLLIIFAAVGVAYVYSCVQANSIAKPLDDMLQAAEKISAGDINYKIKEDNSVDEINKLAKEFNKMAISLDNRGKNLRESNDKLVEMNTSYLDLIGFVSHELKGILSSVILNSYNLYNKLLGPINEAQEKTLKSMLRNLDYLASTVKNFLNLSRVEKAELVISKSEVLIKESVFDISVEAFMQLIKDKEMQVSNTIDVDTKVQGDSGLLQIVVNNLVGNAVKYGEQGGRINISAKKVDDFLQISVYNDGRPIASIDVDKLFKKFSRLKYAGMERIKGTGIGLFITKELVEKHGGSIWVEPKEKGNEFFFTIKLS